MASILKAIKWLLSSKKRAAAVVAVLFAALSPLFAKIGVTITLDQVEMVVGTLIAYIVGQGLADIGKESAAITAEAKKKK